MIDNAIRYTPAGGKMTLSLSGDEAFAKVSVSDTGVGISEEHIPNLFKRFYRADRSRSGDQSGTGLGLAISQRIAQLHGGRIEVQSEVGKGSTFTVFLPLATGRK